MNLTKGQKEALARRAQKIVDEKRNTKKEELMKNWVPTPEEQEYLHNVEIVVSAIEKARTVAEKAGFRPCYRGFEVCGEIDRGRTINYRSDDTLEEVTTYLQSSWAEKQLTDIKYPTWEEVVDEVELLTMSKDFDVDAFLKKYQDL